MSEPYLGEIRAVSFNYAPKGWALCNGQLLSIQQNAALFSILGTTYGGNGINTFGLPNLQGRAPVHPGNSILLGEQAGAVGVTLTANQAGHGHSVSASASATSNTAGGNFPGKAASSLYGASPNTIMNNTIVSNAGGSQPHSNQQPYLVVTYVIALVGIFPSRG